MLATDRRTSAFRQAGGARKDGRSSRPSAGEVPKREIWSTLLDSVASSKKLPEKDLIVLGS